MKRKWLLAGGGSLLIVLLVPVLIVVVILGGANASSSSCQPVATLDLGTSASSATVTAASQDPQWSVFEEAERQQETGSPQGDPTHNSADCQGSYCWLNASIWSAMASEGAVNVSAYPDAYNAPEAVQDAVFTGVSFPVYQKAGGGQAGYSAAAAAWNGGTTAVVSNPGLGNGATNYTYANAVLAKMAKLLGQPAPTSSASSQAADCSATVATGNYANPLRGVTNLLPERIDQGVDYTGSGPVYAIGDGTVVNLYNAGWPGGVFIVYRLSDGPEAGWGVYVAEDLDPTVTVGQQVTANTQIATMTNGSAGIETGWADLSSLGDSAAVRDHQAATTGDAGSVSTGCGQSFDQLLVGLGAPGGNLQGGSTVTTAC